MSRQIDEFSKGETATIAGVISDLKAQEYNIEQRTSGLTTVIGIELNESNVRMNKDSEEILTYTLVYGEGTVRYFVEIDGKYYEMKFNNGTFTINTEETDSEGINQEPKVTAKSNVENIATAEKTEGKDEIVINSLNELGETTITIKEENSGIATVCNVKVMTLIESITFKQETINIEKGNNVELNALVTINPADTTETLIWTTENGEIVEITEEGRLVGVKEGTTTIKVTNEDGTIEAICTVKVVISATGINLNKSTTTINKGNTDTLTVAITPEDTTDPVNWTSENTSVVTITPDVTGRTATIRAIKAGTSRITVTCGSLSKTCIVTAERFSGLNTADSNPEGAMPSGNVTIVESDASKGIVIKDKNNREWVWIQVPKTTVFKTATSSTDYTNIKLDLFEYAKTYRGSLVDEWTSGCGIKDSVEYSTVYNKMLKSIYTNGGFWIQRYEDGTTSITCANAQIKASGYTPDTTKTSSLPFGIQWDLVCRYLEGKEGLTRAMINSDSSSWGNYSNSISAGLERNKKINIYDFAGNLAELTLEHAVYSGRNYPHTIRGGWAISSTEANRPASYRLCSGNGYWPNGIGQSVTFRATMY